MPVTAKLSRRFYETFGDEIANELVQWFNSVDATYRSDLRDFNELNFARFDAKMEQRLAEFSAKMERRFAEFTVELERRFAEFAVVVERRFAQQDAKWERRFAEQDAKWEQRIAGLEVKLIRWMFLYWTGTMLGLAGFLFAALRFR
jgi:CRP-like cAMP-binding protein